MTKRLSVCVILPILLLVTAQVCAQNRVVVMSINTEWFWDSEEPHEGSVAIGPRGNPPTENEVNLEAYTIARFITEQNANIVGLIEVENQNVVDKIRGYLPEQDWVTVFDKGRDSMTGQDVAILTRFSVITGTTTDLGHLTGEHRPSKVLGVGLNVGSNRVYVVVAHLISKRSSNDIKRLNQASHIRNHTIDIQSSYDHTIILGDMNDTPDSPPLRRLRGLDDDSSDFIQTAIVSVADPAYSYKYNNHRQLIDHILLSESLLPAFDALSTGQRHRTIDLGPISDHRAVVVGFVLN